jgi:hypothetical protein
LIRLVIGDITWSWIVIIEEESGWYWIEGRYGIVRAMYFVQFV